MKKIAIVFFSVLLALLGPQVLGASTYVDDGWPLLDLPIKGYFSVQFRDGRGNMTADPGSPYLSWKDGTQTLHGPRQILCNSLNSSDCSQNQGSFDYFTRLPFCSTASDLDCIESLMPSLAGKELSVTFSQKFPTKTLTTYSGNPTLNLPMASSGSIIDIPGAPHSKGSKYFIDVRERGSKSTADGKFKTTSLGIGIYAIDLVNTFNDDATAGMVQRTDGPGSEYLGAKGIYPAYVNQQVDCVMSGDDACADRRGLPEGLSFSLVLRLSSSPSGWLHGRISDANIQINPINDSQAVRFSISGGSIRVPAVGVGMKWTELKPLLQTEYIHGGFDPHGAPLSCRWCSNDPLENTTVSQPKASGEAALSELKAWLPIVGDKSNADINTWSLRTLDSNEMSGAPSCFADQSKLLGLVTTNSTVYSAGPPTFAGGSLNYQVAAPHTMSNGETTKGDYKLMLRSDVARCIYKFSSAPINASISVISEAGNQSIATSAVSENNGWLTLTAKNFTFSSPTIKVKLSQTGATGSVESKQQTIRCTKGKTSIKIMTAKPVCPKGDVKK